MLVNGALPNQIFANQGSPNEAPSLAANVGYFGDVAVAIDHLPVYQGDGLVQIDSFPIYLGDASVAIDAFPIFFGDALVALFPGQEVSKIVRNMLFSTTVGKNNMPFATKLKGG